MEKSTRILALAAALMSAACVDALFTCSTDSQCAGVPGARCAPTGFCMTPDTTCGSGYRYESHATARLSGACVTPSVDLSVIDARVPSLADLAVPIDACVGSATDPNNCGACGNVCGAGLYCENGACVCPGELPTLCGTDLGQTCVNETTDVDNCGACGNACASGQLCQASACVETCAPLYTDCTTYCALATTDPNNCGGCGVRCSPVNIVRSCGNGTCDGTCRVGYADCNANKLADGCETNVLTDLANCGACNATCTRDPNATSVACEAGTCTQTCNIGYVTCGTSCCAAGGLYLLAGHPPLPPNTDEADGTGTAARFDYPYGLAFDQNGNLFVSDILGQTIRMVTQAGVVTTVAGVADTSGYQAGIGGMPSQFSNPGGIAFDTTGTLYIADSGNNAIRELLLSGASAGEVPTLGTQSGSYGSPFAVAVDTTGNIYVGAQDGTLSQITQQGVVTTLPGTIASSTLLAVDAAGTLYSTDHANIWTLTSSGQAAAEQTPFNDINGLAVDSAGTIYMTHSDGSVDSITAQGVVTPIAGVEGVSGIADGIGSAAHFNEPQGIVIDASQNLYVADTPDGTIRKITPDNVVSTFAGYAPSGGNEDGAGWSAQFNRPAAVTVDASGTVYVADTGNGEIRKVTAAGVVTTLATGLNPAGLVVDDNGDVYESDQLLINKISAVGAVTLLAGNNGVGTLDGTGSAAQFESPAGVAIDGSHNLFVADTGGQSIRKITLAGVVTTVAGSINATNVGVDGTGTSARFASPAAVVCDGQGNLYVTDAGSGYAAIRKIAPGPVVTTIAGGANTGFDDGTGSAATFTQPNAIAIDAQNNLYATDMDSGSVRQVTPAGVVTTVVGFPGLPPGGAAISLGPLPGRLISPSGIATFHGALIIADGAANAIFLATKVGGF